MLAKIDNVHTLSANITFVCVSHWRAFLACFEANASKLYIYRHYTYIVISCNVKNTKAIVNCLTIAETNIVLIGINSL